MPAVDIMGGNVVRLAQGKRGKKVYSRDPIQAARHWARQKAEFLHVVDLDAAITSRSNNRELAKQIPQALDIPVEIGGGVRTISAISELLDAGFARVVLGTRAVEDKKFLKSAFKKFKDRVIVSIDAKEGQILTKGWRNTHKGLTVIEFVDLLKEVGFKEIIYTDTLKDGMLKGPNIKAIKTLLKTGIKVIASGGVSSLDDLRKLKSLERSGLSGVIVGKALYEGRFTLAQALKLT